MLTDQIDRPDLTDLIDGATDRQPDGAKQDGAKQTTRHGQILLGWDQEWQDRFLPGIGPDA